MVLLGLVGLLGTILMARKPQWVKKKEEEVEKRDKALKKAKKQAERAENNYKEMMKKHDDEIGQARKKPGKDDIDNPDDAADYLDSILSDDGRRRWSTAPN